MSSLNVSANHYLRNLYAGDRSLVKIGERAKVTNTALTKADSSALGRGISAIEDYDFDSDSEDKTDFYNTLKAFADSYNYTLDSGAESSDRATKSLVSRMKDLKETHGDRLADFGITFDEDGYMSISKSAVDNISTSRFKEVLGDDTDFMDELSQLQKRLKRHVNYLA